MTYKNIYMTFKIKRHMHARVIFRCNWAVREDITFMMISGDIFVS